jgi:hypothetical protein
MPKSGGNKPGSANRAARLAAELRLNLKKRKEQARARAAAPSADASEEHEAREDGGD